MKEIVVISGKGGTGKTSISSSFAYLEPNAIVADCDVDAANMHLLLDADFEYQEDFFSGEVAVIDEDKCTSCGKCYDVCRFDAISKEDGFYKVNPIDCEGCWYCYRVCKDEAITMQTQKAGDLYISNIKNGSKMAHAKLGFGAENSGKLVAHVKKHAKSIAKKENKEFIITDGSPGIGCPVISSLSGANLVVLVTEASVSGLHDLERVFKLIKTFKLDSVCIINKYDLNEEMTSKIEQFIENENSKVIAKLPYDETFTKAMSEAKTIIEYNKDSDIAKAIIDSWREIKNHLADTKR
ncbi:MAG: (4Fe-4S)-binding protein [Epsilonproteobacteria bacterium]|nr:(4Fe-4S)-binding protein [Campylobacterota bacterium]